MKKASKSFRQELMELEKIKKAAEQDIKNAPDGTLRIAKNKNTDQYYWRTDPKDTTGKYIRKSEEQLIKGLAQKDYAQKVLALLEPIIKTKKKELQQFGESSAQEQLIAIYENLLPARQKLITPYVYSDEAFAAQWEREKKTLKETLGSFIEADSEIYTEQGECVRSKSEKILADKLFIKKVPYVYELPLYLKEYGYIRPDFLVLNKKTRKEYYWEHFGMMDDKEYCEKALKKIENFEKNGLFPGKNLILTYETKEHPLNIKIVEQLIKEFLM